MPDFLEGFKKSFKKDVWKKDAENLPSLDKMIENTAEGYNFATEHKMLYGVDEYHVTTMHDPAQINAGRSQAAQKERIRLSRKLDDLKLRKAIKDHDMTPVLPVETEEEADFRRKEASYEDKSKDQEKAAQQRNEVLPVVTDQDLDDKIDEIREELNRSVDPEDSYAVGEHEFYKQYLEVALDLQKTRASKGKIFGNYKKHIALAEEKYHFYTRHKERIIGKEMAKALMKKPEFETELESAKQADPMIEQNLADEISDAEFIWIKQFVNPGEQEIMKKAIRDHRECSKKVYELTKRLETIEAMESKELDEKKAKLPKNDAAAWRIVNASLSGMPLLQYKRSIEAEIKAWQFHADAGLLLVKHLSDPHGDTSGILSAHAAYINEHYGINIYGLNTKAKLSDQGIATRIGFESEESDISRTFSDPNTQVEAARHFGKMWKERSERARTGYDLQNAYERTASEAASYDMFKELGKERSLGEGPSDAELMEECVNMTVLSKPLPALGMLKYQAGDVDYQAMFYNGVRDKNGEFVPQAPGPVSPEQLRAQVAEHKMHVSNMQIIRSSKDAAAVKAAILAEIPMVRTAFEDIDSFMNVGDSKNIFTAKTHAEIFSNTAGLPTFERKARLLRDLISSMLRQKDSLLQAENESGISDLRKELTHKWLLMNRALSFVDYRKQMMANGYGKTPEEWANDSSEVQDFWSKSDYTALLGRGEMPDLIDPSNAGPVLRRERPAAGAAVAAAAAAAEEDDAEELSEKPEITEKTVMSTTGAASGGNPPVEGEEDTWSDRDKRTWREMNESVREARQGAIKLRKDTEDALEGLSKTERHYLRMDRYEQSSYSTRKMQRDEIIRDLLKGTSHSNYSAEYYSIGLELLEVNEQIKQRSTIGLRKKQAALMAQQATMLELMNSIMRSVEERADRILTVVKEPEGERADVERNIETLLRNVDGPSPDGSVDEALRADIKARAERIMGLVHTTSKFQLDEAIRQTNDLLAAIRAPYIAKVTPYIDENLTYLERTVDDSLAGQTMETEVADGWKKIFRGMRADLADPNLKSKKFGLIASNLRSYRAKFTKDYKGPRPPFIDQVEKSAESIAAILKIMKKKQNKPKRGGKVSFADDISIAQTNEDTLEVRSSVQVAFQKEEQAVAAARQSLKDMAEQSMKTAFADLQEDLTRTDKAAIAMGKERKEFTAHIRSLSDRTIKNIPGADGMDRADKEFLSDMGSLIVPLSMKNVQFDGDEDPSRKEDVINSMMDLHIGNMLVLKDKDAKPEDVRRALAETEVLVNTAYGDIKDFATEEPGSLILQGRRMTNYERMPYEEKELGNIGTDTEGMPTLKIKATELRKVIGLALERKDMLPESVEVEFERKAHVLDGLLEFLQWREDAIDLYFNEAAIERKRKTHIEKTRENSTRWNHDPFVFE